MSEEERVGTVIHFYDRISVAVIQLEADLKLGDRIRFSGKDADFSQEVDSMQIEHDPVESVEAGGEVAVKVEQEVSEGTEVFRAKG